MSGNSCFSSLSPLCLDVSCTLSGGILLMDVSCTLGGGILLKLIYCNYHPSGVRSHQSK